MKCFIFVCIISVFISNLFAKQISMKNGTVIEIANPIKRSRLCRDVKATIISATEYKVNGGVLYIKAESELTYDEKELVILNCTLGKESIVIIDGRKFTFAKDSQVSLSGSTFISSGILAHDVTIKYAGKYLEVKGDPIPATVNPGYSVGFMFGKLNTILTSRDFEISLDGMIVPVKGLTRMQLRKNGDVEYIYSVRLSRDAKFIKNGELQQFNSTANYEFDENEKFIGTNLL